MTRKTFRFSMMAHGLPLLAACFVLFTVKELLSKPAAEPQTPTYAPVIAPYDARVAGIGIVEPKSELISLGTHLDGIINTVHVAVGDKVKKGDALFTLDERETRARLASARATQQEAVVALADAKSQLAFYEKIADPAAVSREELTRRRFAVQRAEATAKEASARVDEVETELARLTVRAPIDGEILRLNARPGEYAKTGVLAEPLVTMGDTSTMHVRVEVDEADAQAVKAGKPAKGALRSAGDKTVDLAFVRFEPLLQPKGTLTGSANERVDTRVLQVIYALQGNDIGAYSGQQMDVFIEAEKAE
jgi:RND family efflux transporter MFP subunit